jgi:O-antigen/teichoic acid export membrane protein
VRDESALLSALHESDRSGVRLLGLRLGTYAVAFAASVLIARSLGPQGRGEYALPMVVLAIAFTLGNLGIEHAQIHFAGRKVPLRTLWSNATAAGAIVSLIAWTISAIALFSGAGRTTAVPVVWLCVGLVQLPLLLHTLYWTNLLQLSGKLPSATATALVGMVVQATAVGVLVLADALSPFSVLLLSALGNTLTWAGTLRLCRRAGLVGNVVDAGVLKRTISFGLRAQMGILFIFLLLRVDQIMVQRILGFQALGLYALAVTLAELMWLLSDPFAAALLHRQVAADGDDDLRLGYGTARLGLLAVGSASVVAWIVAPSFIEIAYGRDFVGSVWPFRLLLPGVVVLSIQRPLAAVLLKRGRPWLAGAIGGVALALNVLINLVLIPLLGVSGAALSSSAAYIFVAVSYVVATRDRRVVGPEDLIPGRADANRLVRAIRSSLVRSTV